jgi:hypothetical protein
MISDTCEYILYMLTEHTFYVLNNISTLYPTGTENKPIMKKQKIYLDHKQGDLLLVFISPCFLLSLAVIERKLKYNSSSTPFIFYFHSLENERRISVVLENTLRSILPLHILKGENRVWFSKINDNNALLIIWLLFLSPSSSSLNLSCLLFHHSIDISKYQSIFRVASTMCIR